jgi:hypothetical protein
MLWQRDDVAKKPKEKKTKKRAQPTIALSFGEEMEEGEEEAAEGKDAPHKKRKSMDELMTARLKEERQASSKANPRPAAGAVRYVPSHARSLQGESGPSRGPACLSLGTGPVSTSLC